MCSVKGIIASNDEKAIVYLLPIDFKRYYLFQTKVYYYYYNVLKYIEKKNIKKIVYTHI